MKESAYGMVRSQGEGNNFYSFFSCGYGSTFSERSSSGTELIITTA